MADGDLYYIGPLKKGYVERYGINWKKDCHPIAVELACFREKMAKRMKRDQGDVLPEHHFMAVSKIFWPEEDGIDKTTGRKIIYPVKFVWHKWAVDMLKACCNEDYIAIAGCGGVGKSEFVAVWMIICFISDPDNTLCLCTSTTLASSKKKLWAKVVQFWVPLEKMGLPGKLADTFGVIRFVDANRKAVKGDMAGISLIAAEKKKEKEAVGKLIGMHQEIIIFVADELGELSEAITEAAFNNLARGCRRFQFIGISNPDSYFDPFGKFAKPKDGWESISVEDDSWKTDRGICLHFDTLKNPRIMGDARCFWMDSQEAIDKEIALKGEKSASFWRMWRGFWCPNGATEKIYTEVEILNCKADQPAIWLDTKKEFLSFLDPSFTNGGDRAIAHFGTLGANKEGIQTLEYNGYEEFHEDITNKDFTRSQQMISWWRDKCNARQVVPRNAGFDCTGGGGPFGEMVDIMWSKEVYKLNFGGKAPESAVSAYDSTPACDRYVNKVSWIWYALKEPLRNGQIRGLCPDMIQEMTQREKEDEKGIHLRIKVMSKADMKAETGMSPDIGDSGMGLAALAYERLGFNSGTVTRKQTDPKKTSSNHISIFRKLNSVYTQDAA